MDHDIGIDTPQAPGGHPPAEALPPRTPAGGFTRRQAVLGVAALTAQAAGLGGLAAWPGAGDAQPAGAAVATLPAGDAAAGRFLAFSRAITGHGDLDAATAARMHAAMVHAAAGFAAQADALAALVRPGQAPEALLEAAAAAGLRDAALAVVAGWYTGTVGQGAQTTVVAYADALMYRPVADGLTVPTYCNYGPLWWTAEPPAANVPTPKETALRAPPPPVMRSQ